MVAAGALSIGAFERSRWRLRRTRHPMGIESTLSLPAPGVWPAPQQLKSLFRRQRVAEGVLAGWLGGVCLRIGRVQVGMGTRKACVL
jgi:hypothetical protein